MANHNHQPEPSPVDGVPASEMASVDQTNSRTEDRFAVHDLWCDAGQLRDLSRIGASLVVKDDWAPGATRPITIRGIATDITLDATCVWRSIQSDGETTVGLHFEHLTAQQEDTLDDMSQSHASY
ncbi:MAG: PilZ domain-containing protein [Phycisphaerales bacterium]|nr:PilZ domain-containing protein [Phycisphaerales bacterium]